MASTDAEKVDDRTVATQAQTNRHVKIWSNPQSIIVPVRESRLPHFEHASRQSALDGWPIVTRNSPGMAIPHGPGTICLSLRWIDREPPGHGVAFETLSGIIIDCARSLGWAAITGEVAHAMCPGHWDVAIDGQKIAGLAQRRLARNECGMTVVIAHALIFCGIDLAKAVAATNTYYNSLGQAGLFHADAHRNMVEAIDIPIVVGQLTALAAKRNFLVESVS
jgi:lipoate-protein ligase A